MPSEPVPEDRIEEQADTSLTPGDVLRQERLRRNLSEKAVADKLHITMHYVKALESNTYEKLPSAVFTKGYIKNYALLLELEVDDLYSLYEEYNAQLQQGKDEENKQRARRKKDRNKPWVVLSLLVFVGGFAGLWLYNNSSDEDVLPESEVPESDTVGAAANQRQLTPERVNQLAVEPAPTPASAGIGEVLESIEDQPMIEESPVEAAVLDAQAAEQLLEANAVADAPNDLVAVLSSLAASDQFNSAVLEPANEASSAEAEEVADGPRIIEVVVPGSDVLRITFSGGSWVEVGDSSAEQIYRDLREDGDVLEITGSAPFTVLLGDAPFASLTLNDAEIDMSANIRIDNSARITVGQ